MSFIRTYEIFMLKVTKGTFQRLLKKGTIVFSILAHFIPSITTAQITSTEDISSALVSSQSSEVETPKLELKYKPTPLKTEVFQADEEPLLADHIHVNRLKELINLMRNEGAMTSWIITKEEQLQINNSVTLNDEAQIKNIITQILTRSLRKIFLGFVTPEQVSDKTTIQSKPFYDQNVNTAIKGFFSGIYTPVEIMSVYRPQNIHYKKLVSYFQYLKNLSQSGQLLPLPAKLTTIKEGSTDAASILFARQRLQILGYQNNTQDPNYSEDLKLAIENFQENNLLKLDGVIGPQSFRLINMPIRQFETKLRINIDRARWLPNDIGSQSEYVFVNLPAQRLFYYKNNSIALSFKTINGRTDRPTPVMLDKINHVRINPTWTVPNSIFAKDKLSHIIENPGYITENNFRLIDNYTGLDVDPYSVNWAWIQEQVEIAKASQKTYAFPYRLRQNPGAWNALGFIKFPLLVNTKAIYLHDTNDRSLFQNTNRLLSSGCVRVEKPFELAELLFDGVTTAESFRDMTERLVTPALDETKISIGRTVPVYLLYETVQINDHGQVTVVGDPYGLDMDMYNLLNGVPVISPYIYEEVKSKKPVQNQSGSLTNSNSATSDQTILNQNNSQNSQITDNLLQMIQQIQ